MATSRAITLGSNLIKMTVLLGYVRVGTACAVTLAGYFIISNQTLVASNAEGERTAYESSAIHNSFDYSGY